MPRIGRAERDDFLTQTETEIDAEYLDKTEIVRFADFDLQFLLTSHASTSTGGLVVVSPADLCYHTLLIEDTRSRSYCLLLLSHIDVSEL